MRIHRIHRVHENLTGSSTNAFSRGNSVSPVNDSSTGSSDSEGVDSIVKLMGSSIESFMTDAGGPVSTSLDSCGIDVFSMVIGSTGSTTGGKGVFTGGKGVSIGGGVSTGGKGVSTTGGPVGMTDSFSSGTVTLSIVMLSSGGSIKNLSI